MFTFILVLLVLDSIVLIAAILLQAGKGSGLAASFGGVSSSADSLLGTRQAGNLLTKTSWVGGALFLFLSFVLSLMSSRQRAPKSILDETFSTPPASSAPAQTAPGSTTGGVNLTPATPAPAAGTQPAGATPTTPAPAKP